MKLENVAIRDALPFDAIANTWNVLEAPEHQWPNFDSSIYIHYAAPLYSAPIYLLRFGKVWLTSFADLCVQRLAIMEGG